MANATDTQRRTMYLFERVGEPLFLGPRGNQNYLYDIPNLNQQQRHASTSVRATFTGMTDPQFRITNMNTISVASSVQLPSNVLSTVSRLCPKGSLFSYFLPPHREAARDLRRILINEQNRDNFIALACLCRDSPMVNTELWVFAFAGACLARRDMRGFIMPALFEILPSSFFDSFVIRQAQQQASVPSEDRSVIEIERNFTGDDNNPENVLAYYREDLGINTHHWHWHLIYTAEAPRTGQGSRNRKGELFYYMHHSMLARYDVERMCNGFPVTVPLDLAQRVPEGYFPKLTDTNSGRIWGSRQEGTMIMPINRMLGDRLITVSPDQIRQWSDRISEAIDTGVVLGDNNQRMPLTEESGIDILGDIVENGGMVSPNMRYYGDLHNMGHAILAFAHDPVNRHREFMGVMADTATAMRDPVFYRWHKYVDNIFTKYKETLQPYTQQQLLWPGIQVTGVTIRTPGQQQENVLITHWTQSEVDLARGLDLGRNAATMGPIRARFTHLNNERFTYQINVTNGGSQAINGTVRIFMAPRNNERGQRLSFRDQRLLFFEMDKFTAALQPGSSQISRRSQDSTLIVPWMQTFRDLENLPQRAEDINGTDAVCGCGWPEHMLLPRGAPSGILFDLFVMITNAAEDAVARVRNQTEGQRQGCKDAVAFCGLLDEMYPDRKAMGFPFDRNAVMLGTRTPVSNLDGFIPAGSNMFTRQVMIVHNNRTTIRQSGTGGTTAMGTNPQSAQGRPNGQGQTRPRPNGNSPQQGGRRRQPSRNNSGGGGRNSDGITFGGSTGRSPSPSRPRGTTPPRTPSPQIPSWSNWGYGNHQHRGHSPDYFWGDE